jgi:hypothetical protein
MQSCAGFTVVAGIAPTLTVSVDELVGNGFVRRARSLLGGDRLFAYRSADHFEPLFPLFGTLRFGLPWVWWRLPRFDVSGTGWSLLGPSMHDLGVVVKPVDAVIAGSQSGSGRSCQTAPVLSLWRSQR